MTRVELNPGSRLWKNVLFSIVNSELGRVFQAHNIKVQIEPDGETLRLFPIDTNATIFLTPGGIDAGRSSETSLMNALTPYDFETVQTLIGSTAASRKYHYGMRAWCLGNILGNWGNGQSWERRLHCLAHAMRETYDAISTGKEPERQYETPDNMHLIDSLSDGYVVVDVNLPENSYGYSHSFCMFINMIDNLFQQLSYVDQIHPHISGNGRFCIDHAFRASMQDRLKAGDLFAFLVLLQEALMTMNFRDSYNRYPDLVQCKHCNNQIRESETIRCAECRKTTCSSCIDENDNSLCKNCGQKEPCPTCGRRSWKENRNKCHTCGKEICKHCRLEGPGITDDNVVIRAAFCKDCVPRCTICESQLSVGSSRVCSSCGNLVCRRCTIASADQSICRDCEETCVVCGGSLPTTHSHTCTECGGKICCEHTVDGIDVVMCVSCHELKNIEAEHQTEDDTTLAEDLARRVAAGEAQIPQA